MTRLTAVLAIIFTAMGISARAASATNFATQSPSAFVSLFEQANSAYEKGRFREAAAAYQNILGSGKASAPLLFNLGNAWFKAGETGRAVAAYREALRLAPRDPDIAANLQFARATAGGVTLKESRLQQALGKLSLNEWSWSTAAAFWLLLFAVAARAFRPALRASLKTILISASLLCAVLFGCLLLRLSVNDADGIAVVVVPAAPVRHGPLTEAQTAFEVRNGAELKVIDQKPGWFRVEAGPRMNGWIEARNLLMADARQMAKIERPRL